MLQVVEQYELRVERMRELSKMVCELGLLMVILTTPLQIQEDEAEVKNHEEKTKKLKEE